MSCATAQKPRTAGAEFSVSEARSTGKSISDESSARERRPGWGALGEMTGQIVPMGMTTQCRLEVEGLDWETRELGITISPGRNKGI